MHRWSALSGLFIIAATAVALPAVACKVSCEALDAVDIVDSRDGVFLVLRATGIHEKALFFEGYRAKPEFDVCGKPRTPPFADDYYDDTQGLLRSVEVHGNSLEIIYTSNRAEAVLPQHARLSLQP
jgi:hypothetical protein